MINVQRFEVCCQRIAAASTALAAQYARFAAVVVIVAVSLVLHLPGI
jgi:hypothetical protein